MKLSYNNILMEEKKAERRAETYKDLLIGSIAVVFLALGFSLRGQLSDYFMNASQAGPKEALPYYDQVRRIISPLCYSGLEMLERPDVSLGLDFINKQWTLYNVHSFDEAGDLILEQGRYGACGELAAHTYKYVKPLFGGEYEISFAKVLQSGYFLSPEAMHIVLCIEKKAGLFNPQRYIIDPSLHKYGPISDFEDYMFLEMTPALPFLEMRETDIKLPVSNLVPLLIKKDYLIGLVVEGNGIIFDEQNYVVAVTLTKKYHFAGRYLFAMRNNNGRKEILENKELAKNLLKEEEYMRLRANVERLFAERRLK